MLNTTSNNDILCNDYADVLQHCLEQATQRGASAAALHFSRAQEMDLTVRMQKLESLCTHQEKTLSLTVYRGQQQGVASTTDLSLRSLDQLIDKALALAAYTQADPAQGLADSDQLAWDAQSLDLYHPSQLDTAEIIAQLTEAEAMALALPKISSSEGMNFSAAYHLGVYANSRGFLKQQASSIYSYSATFLAENESEKQRDYDYTVSRIFDNLQAPDAMAKNAANFAERRLGATTLPTQRAAIILDARLARAFWGHFLAAINGPALYKEASFLLNTLHQAIFPDFVEITTAPYLQNAMASMTFDSDGLPVQPMTLVEKGRLQSYILGLYASRRLALPATSNAANVIVKATQPSLESLFHEMDTGFFVTELLGHGVDLVTGNYSRGAAGFWIEKGKIAYPVQGVTIAGNLKEFFEQISGIGGDIDTRGGVHTGSILIDQVAIAGS